LESSSNNKPNLIRFPGCEIGPWGAWSQCTGCGLVVQRRHRKVTGSVRCASVLHSNAIELHAFAPREALPCV
jgi:hypothetical protein